MTRLRMIAAAVALAALSMGQAGGSALADVLVVIDKSTQTMSVAVNGRTRYHWEVSTGRRGYGTPTGRFRPQWMARTYFSRKYYNSPMPHSIFFYHGYAIHGTEYIHRLGGPASHGCVRLHPRNAATLFALVQRHGMHNTRIIIEDAVARRRPFRQSLTSTPEDREIVARTERLLLAEQIERREAVARMEHMRAKDALLRMQARRDGKAHVPNPDGFAVAIGVQVNGKPSEAENVLPEAGEPDTAEATKPPTPPVPLPRRQTAPKKPGAKPVLSGTGGKPTAGTPTKPRPRVEQAPRTMPPKISSAPLPGAGVTLLR